MRVADRGRRYGRAHLPGPRRRALPSRAPGTRLSSPGSAASAASRPGSSRRPGSRSGGSSCARCGARDATSTSCSTRSASRPRCRRRSGSSRAAGPDAIFTTGGYVAIPVIAGGAPPADPHRAVGRQRGPRPQRPGDRAPGRGRRRHRSEDLRGARGAPLLRDRDADPRPAGDRPRGRPRAARHRRRASAPAPVFGGSQAVRRFNAAVAEALAAARRTAARSST